MATNDSDADIMLTFGGKVEKGTGKKIEQELQNEVDKIDITIPINESNIKLSKAQRKVTDTISNLISKGFSSAGKDPKGTLDKQLTSFLNEAKKAGIYGPGKNNPVVQEIKRQVTEQKRQITEWKRFQKSTQAYDVKIQNNRTKPKKARYIPDKDEDAKIRRAIRNHAAELQNKEFEGKSTGKSGLPKLRLSYLDPGRTNEEQQRLNEYSFYGNKNYTSQARELLKINRQLAKKGTYRKVDPAQIDEVLAEIHESDPKHIRTSTAPGTAKKRGRPKKESPNLQAKNKTTDTWEESLTNRPGRFSRKTTKLEDLESQMNKALSDLQSVLRDLENGIDVFSDGKANDAIKVALKMVNDYHDEKDKGILEGRVAKPIAAVEKLEGALQAIYTQSSKKLIAFGHDEEQGIGPGHEEAMSWLKELQFLLKEISESAKRFKNISKDISAVGKTIRKSLNPKTINSKYNEKKEQILDTNTLESVKEELTSQGKDITKAVNTQTNFDKIKNDETSVKQDTQIKKLDDTIGLSEEEIDVVETDKQTGFNSDMAAKEVTKKLTTSNKIMGVDQFNALANIEKTTKDILTAITSKQFGGTGGVGDNKNIVKNNSKSNLPSTKIWQPWFNGGGAFIDSQVQNHAAYIGAIRRFVDKTNYQKLFSQINKPSAINDIESERKLIEQGKHPSQQRTFVGQSIDTAKENQSFLDRLKDILTGSTTKVDEIMAANVDAQRKMLAERAETYGLSDASKRTTVSGDIVQASRRKNLYQSLFGRETVNPFKDLKLTEGIGIDTTAITDALQKAIENNMFNAQTGGWMNNIAIAMTGGIAALFQPSLEKSRSQADTLNTALANERQAIQELLQRIQTDEDYLKAMEKSGKAKFNEDGTLAEGSSKEAWTLFAEMENFKHNLRGVLADTAAFNEVIKASGGNMALVAKRASFVAPELRKNNVLLQNMNAGLDKNGKVLKFQRRSAEILNYAFQLMGRNIGQMVKGLLATLNPISLIKRAFSDFASYNTKWQRTLNVIKYNLRAILAPLMDKIAQTIVNIIGLVQSLANGIRSAFGYGKIDLFDQSAASAEKMKEELEAAANVTASFDELHDIGSDNSGANDLYGDIYTPQWTGLQEIFEKIGKTLGNIGAIVSGLDFWQWLAIGGAALAGFLVLKAILNWFSGKNPLQSVANGVQSFLTSVGWALLILSITEFVKALTAFVECMKSATWEDIVKTFVMLGGAFAGLVLTAGGLMYLSTALGMFSTELLGLAALVTSFALLIEAIADFISVTKECTSDELIQGWATLAATLGTVGLVITGLLIAISGVGVALAPGILATAAMVASIALVIAAVALLVKALDGAGDDIKLILDGLANNVQAVGNTLIGIINAITNAFTAGVNAVIAGVSLVASLFGKDINVSYIPSLQTSYIPKYAKGTNYVPNDGLAYLHQGEAVIPKKYNQHLNSGITTEERDYMSKMIQTMQLLDNTMRQGINVKGEFKQKGSDLVAVVQKGQNRNGYQPLSNPAYAR